MGNRHRRLLGAALGAIQSWTLAALRWTWRIRIDGLEAFDLRLARGERLAGAFWHGTYAPLFVLLAGRRACIFTSRSFRGTVIAEICRRFGFETEMLEDRGGDDSYERMREAAARHRLIGLAVDGPLGPRHVVKRGVVRLASDLGMAVVPFGVAIDWAKIHQERWDRRALPLPFSRIGIAIGDPIAVPPDLDPIEIDGWCDRIASALADATCIAESSWNAGIEPTGAAAGGRRD